MTTSSFEHREAIIAYDGHYEAGHYRLLKCPKEVQDSILAAFEADPELDHLYRLFFCS